MPDLTKNGYGISTWIAGCDDTFSFLKKKLKSAPALISSRWDRPFQLHVRTSGIATGATLTQKADEGREQVISYESKKLSPAEDNYTANDQELPGVVHGLQRFRCYLEGSDFIVFTDNQVLSNLLTKQQVSEKEVRWQ